MTGHFVKLCPYISCHGSCCKYRAEMLPWNVYLASYIKMAICLWYEKLNDIWICTYIWMFPIASEASQREAFIKFINFRFCGGIYTDILKSLSKTFEHIHNDLRIELVSNYRNGFQGMSFTYYSENFKWSKICNMVCLLLEIVFYWYLVFSSAILLFGLSKLKHMQYCWVWPVLSMYFINTDVSLLCLPCRG